MGCVRFGSARLKPLAILAHGHARGVLEQAREGTGVAITDVEDDLLERRVVRREPVAGGGDPGTVWPDGHTRALAAAARPPPPAQAPSRPRLHREIDAARSLNAPKRRAYSQDEATGAGRPSCSPLTGHGLPCALIVTAHPPL